MTSAEIISQRLNNIERDIRDGFRIDPRWLIQTVREMTAALELIDGRYPEWVTFKCLDRAAGKETK